MKRSPSDDGLLDILKEETESEEKKPYPVDCRIDSEAFLSLFGRCFFLF